MTFKRNVTATVMIHSTVFYFSMIPAALLIGLTIGGDHPHVMQMLGFVAISMIPWAVFTGAELIISVIIGFFLKTAYRLEGERLLVHEREQIKSIPYEKVAFVVFDFGFPGRGNWQNAELVLWDRDLNELLHIKTPSLLMTFLLRRKCPAAKVDYYNRRALFLLPAIVCGISTLIALLAVIFSRWSGNVIC